MFDWQADRAPSPIKLGITETSVPPPVILTAASAAQPITVAPKPSFAQALRGNSALSDPLPVPSIRGDMLSVKITDDIYVRGLDFCKTNLRGRLVLNKGDKPFSSKDLAATLQKLRKVKGPWHLTSLGRGFYEFFFNSQDDMKTVWAAGTVSLKPRLLRLFEWKKTSTCTRIDKLTLRFGFDYGNYHKNIGWRGPCMRLPGRWELHYSSIIDGIKPQVHGPIEVVK
ncbi:DUF4283 domain protein [Medicago truncatula]|uniref:DUF4283 domain protein n=1 Tax=Medicago truncatula TaxID=3880 RepID=G7ZX55_MEDTR|nr:DUF4283 domain protein [Medicago truncatula]